MDHPPHEPIAIVGIGCRFPGGASSPAALWDLLKEGRDAIVPVPPDRWDPRRFYHPDHDRPGKTYVREGGFLQEPIDAFDAQFFGISPREAAVLDPQQRLLLEVTWEALEDAGLRPERLRGSRTGVYVGGFNLDNQTQQFGYFNRDQIASHTATGCSMTMLASRLSYVFDFQGPSLAVDTACSSSLVALHLACQSLWHAESAVAIAGGVNVMLRPEPTITMCKGGFLASDGRCKTFDESADGYGRGEGAGVVILKPLATALADHDRIYAVVIGTGVNQDGRTNGITVPNGEAQQRLIREVCQQAGIAPRQIQYFEAHGTGTPTGDPIEAAAIGAVIGEGRATSDACWIGSIKTNLGHLEAAAGIAGVIKAALALHHRAIPPNLHLSTPNPTIDFEALRLRVPQRLEPWPAADGPARASINAFGYGGTNANALLEAAPAALPGPRPVPSSAAVPLVLGLSARSDAALVGSARQYAQLLASQPELPLGDLAHSAMVRRTHHRHRLAIVANDRDALRLSLEAAASGGQAPGCVRGVVPTGRRGGVVFVYSGMGPQWWGMGAELLAAEPLVRDVVAACDRLWQPMAGWSLHEVLPARPGERFGQPMREPRLAQPANFVLQLALTELWRAWGLEPAAIIGHSVGEIAAAVAAGSLDLADALRLTYHRSRLQQQLVGRGTMLAVGATLEEAERLVATDPERVSLAAVNSPTSVTLAGDADALQAISEQMLARGQFSRLVAVDVAYHSHQMAPFEREFRELLGDLRPGTPRVPLYSTVTGRLVEAGEQDADYWWRNARHRVELAQALDHALTDGHDAFVEVGPHPVLGPSIRECLRVRQVDGVVEPTLRRQEPERPLIRSTLARLYTSGVDIKWEQVYPPAPLVSLPTYAWDRQRLWDESEESRADRLGRHDHPLLECHPEMAAPTWEADLSPQVHPYLADHRVRGAAVFPSSAFVELGLMAAASEGAQPIALEDIDLQHMLMVEQSPIVQCRLDRASGTFEIHSRRLEARTQWTRNASGRVLRGGLPARHPRADLQQINARCGTPVDLERLYERFASIGLEYGPAFRTLRELWIGAGEVLARVALGEPTEDDRAEGGYFLHPALLDGCFQAMIGLVGEDADTDGLTLVPLRMEQVRWFGPRPAPTELWCSGRLTHRGAQSIEGDLLLTDASGEPLAEVYGLRLEAIPGARREAAEMIDSWRYELRWRPSDPLPVADQAPPPTPGRWLLFTDPEGSAAELGSMLSRAGQDCVLADPAASMEQLVREVSAEGPLTGVAYFAGADRGSADDPLGTSDATSILHLVQALDACGIERLRTFAIVTRQAQATQPDEPLDAPAGTAVWGLGRVLANERPALGVHLIDLGPTGSAEELQSLAACLISVEDDETELALHGGARFVPRLVPAETETPEPAIVTSDVPVALDIARPGNLQSLCFVPATRQAPGPGELELAIRASALNFKDVMKAMRLLPARYMERTHTQSELGMESAGTVVAVGEGVEGFQVGDALIAVTARGGFRTFATVPATSVLHKPDCLSFEQSVASLNFITAYYALHDVARLQPGERVLIHSAAGGVGLAAIEVAHWLGAEVIATAGSPDKRRYLQELGIQHVSDSRSLAFVDDVFAWTHGAGVDVVLNSLSGEALFKSVDLLAPYGRFIEIGKRDINDNARLAMRAFDRNLLFAAIDIDRMLVERPELFMRLWRTIRDLLQEQQLAPLPVQVVPASEVADAFETMARGRHIGKLVVNMADQAITVARPPAAPVPIRADATYLITGAFGGFGLSTAEWLVAHGARHLVMVSRSGPTSARAEATLAGFKEQGVLVREARVDVSDARAVADLFEAIASTLPPLRGVFHAAMVLDDGLVGQLDAARFEAVMRPKALGAWHLHQHTQDLSLDAFVLFSSVSSVLGNPGQASYASANAFLDGLAQYRRGLGLPALSVSWGAIKDVGVVARSGAIEAHLNRLGVRGIAARSALDALGLPLAQQRSQAIIAAIDWRKWAEGNAAGARAPRFAEVLSALAEGTVQAGTSAFVDAVRQAEPSERPALVESLLADLVARIMRLPTAQIERDVELSQLGIDSLMVAELNSALSYETGVEIPVIELLRGPSIAELATFVLGQLAPPEDDLLATVHELEEADLDALLLRLMQEEGVGSPS